MARLFDSVNEIMTYGLIGLGIVCYADLSINGRDGFLGKTYDFLTSEKRIENKNDFYEIPVENVPFEETPLYDKILESEKEKSKKESKKKKEKNMNLNLDYGLQNQLLQER